jgi:hypothetical protein
MYFLNLSGLIPTNKQLEFEQTYRFAATQMPSFCKAYSISKDALIEGLYHFTSHWDSMEGLRSFGKSPVYALLVGAFNTLGKLTEKSKGEMVVSAFQLVD